MAAFTAEDYAWGEAYKMPPITNMFKHGNKEKFVQNGTQIFKLLESQILKYKPGEDIAEMDVLDFGCGVGRVIMPFYHKYKRPNAACDMMPAYMSFLKDQVPGANPIQNSSEPPLPYGDASFDVFYAISVWTHMNWKAGEAWLREVDRLLKPGGLALISVSSYSVLDAHRKHRQRGEFWGHITDEMLKENGFAFVARDYPGLKEPYGEIVFDPEWLQTEWSKVIPVKDQLMRQVGGQGGRQDLIVMQKAA